MSIYEMRGYSAAMVAIHIHIYIKRDRNTQINTHTLIYIWPRPSFLNHLITILGFSSISKIKTFMWSLIFLNPSDNVGFSQDVCCRNRIV